MTDHRFAFVSGLHRSGTSLLFRSLRDCPRISGFRGTGAWQDEGQHLQTVYSAARAHGGPGQFGFDPSAHLTECSDLVSEVNRHRLFAEWSKHWDLSKPVLLEKSPPNLIRTRFLQALFPESHFIVILRHPIAVSYATQKFSRTPVASLIEHWLVCHERFEADRQYLRRVLIVRYEDLVAKPQDTLDAVYAFLGLESHPTRAKVRPNVNDMYFTRWHQSTDRFSSSGALNADAIRRQFGKRIARFGYELDRRQEDESTQC